MTKKHVVIIGGGFGGLTAAKILGASKKVHVTLIDRRNHHLFQPLLYQVATAGLSPADIAVPIRAELSRYENATVLLGEVNKINLQDSTLETAEEKLSFDYLIMACGATHSYFGHNEWEKFAPGLKTLEQATAIRTQILLSFEKAEKEKNTEKHKALLTFVIVGGGPTGVELAGAIAEISRYTLEQDFRRIDPSRTRVVLIEAGPRILQSFHPELSKKATRSLEALGVQVWTSTRVTNVTNEGVYLGNEFIQAATVLWAAGVEPSPLGKTLGTALDSVGRVVVTENLNIPSYPHVYVVGDQASFKIENNRTLPGLAPVAIQQGKLAAKNILQQIDSQEIKPFRYIDKGQMATIGRRQAIMQVALLKVTGFLAWVAWLFVHIWYLIGFKNKFFVFLEWTWSYLTFKRGARLIVEKSNKP